MSKKISLLPEHIIDQIKAGEVIERPSTLLKEIIENSIDANSKNIQLQILNNGMELIVIEDDGEGIAFEELPLAFARHATSKIHQFEDIYGLCTYGFRGEALASIASISRITCESTTDSETSHFKIEGGETLSHLKEEKKDKEQGTSLYIKDLFFNTPVRLKFLQSKTSEKNQIKKILNSFLLTKPEIKFSIKWDDNEKDIYPSVEKTSLIERVKKVFFKKGQDDRLLSFEQAYDEIHLHGFLSYETSRGHQNKHQYLFINNRYIQDISLHKIILNTATGFWPFGEIGHYVLYINLPADQIDVNVHPNKTVVKIFEASRVQSVLSGALKKALKVEVKEHESSSLTNNLFLDPIQNKEFPSFKPIQYKTAEESLNQQISSEHNQSFTILNQDFGLYQESEKHFFIIHLAKLIRHAYMKAFHVEEASTPLLISTPYKDPYQSLDHLFTDFSKLGLELDRLDSTTVAIRTTPARFSNFSHEKVLQEIVDMKKKPRNISQFFEMLESLNVSHIDLKTNDLRELIQSFTLPFLIENNIIKELNSLNLKKLFS